MLAALFMPSAAFADQPHLWETGFQKAATPLMQHIENFHDMLLVIITLIVLFVMALLIYVMVRFNEKRNPTPSKTTHNTMIEVLWTVIPVVILVVIAIPSFKLLYFSDVLPKADMTIRATGHQWYWTYDYPDNGKFSFDANVVQKADLKPGQPRLLTTDNVVVVPVGAVVRVLVTSTDVIHSWAVPSFGVKIDAVPGRINHTWFKVLHPGTYYGQCSELCGTNHGYMPIEVRAVSKAAFKEWVAKAQKEFASKDSRPATREYAFNATN